MIRQECGVDALSLELNHPMSIDLLFALERFNTVTFWFRESSTSDADADASTQKPKQTESQPNVNANAVVRERTKRYRFVAAFDKLTKKVGIARCRAIREKQVHAYLRSASRYSLPPSASSSVSSSLVTQSDSGAFHSAVAVPTPNFGTPMRNPNEPTRELARQRTGPTQRVG